MGLARGVVIQPTTFQLPKLQLPFEQMQAQMQGFQQEKDVYDTMKDMSPSHVEGDKPLVQAALKQVKNLVGDVSEQFASGKVSDAMSGIRKGKGVLSEMWKPTGVFGGVQAYYDEYQKALQEVDDFTKGNTDPAYNYVYKRMIQESVKEGSGYDIQTGKRRSVSAPNMLKELDVLKEFDTFAKDWKADQNVGIEARGNYYYWVGTTKQVTEDEVKNAFRSYIQSPKIQEHLRIQAEYQSAGLSEEAQKERKTLYKKEIETLIKTEESRLDIVNSFLNSGNTKKIKQAQYQLGVTPDGIIGEKTKEALDTYTQELKEKKESVLKKVDDMDIVSLTKNQIEKTMESALVAKHAFTEEDGKLVQRADQLAHLRASQAKSLVDYQHSLTGQPETPYYGSHSLQTYRVDTLTNLMSKAESTYKDTYNNFFKKNPELAKIIKSNSGNMRYGEFMPLVIHALQQSQLPNGQFNKEVFKSALEQMGVSNLGANRTYKENKVGFDKLIEGLNQNQIDINDLVNFNMQIEEPYAIMQDNRAMLGSLSSKLIDNENFDNMFILKGYKVQVSGNRSVNVAEYYTPEELRQKVRNGDTEVIQKVVDRISPEKLQEYTVTSKAYSFGGGVAKEYDNKILQQIQGDPRSLLTILAPDQLTYMNKAVANSLGLKKQKDGTYTIDPTIKIENISVANTLQNGTSNNVLTIQISKGEGKDRKVETVNLSDVALNNSYLLNRTYGIASSYIDQDGNIKDEGAFKNLAVNAFDMSNSINIAYNSSHLANLARSGRFKTNITTINMPYVSNLYGQSVSMDVASGLFEGDDGKIYHVYGRDQAANVVLAAGNNMTNLRGLLSQVPSEFSNNIVATQVGTVKDGRVKVDDTEIQNAIFDMKANLYVDEVHTGAMNELKTTSRRNPQGGMSQSNSSSISIPLSLLEGGDDE